MIGEARLVLCAQASTVDALVELVNTEREIARKPRSQVKVELGSKSEQEAAA